MILLLVLVLLVFVLCTGYQQKEACFDQVMRPHLPAQLMAWQCHSMLPALSEQLSRRTLTHFCWPTLCPWRLMAAHLHGMFIWHLMHMQYCEFGT